MAKRGTPKNFEDLWEERGNFFSVDSDPDVIAAIVGASYVDVHLTSLLRTLFTHADIADKMLDDNSGELGTFGSKCKFGYGIGLLWPDEFRDLQFIGKVRNHLAHSHLAADFSDPQVVAWCDELTSQPIARNPATGGFDVLLPDTPVRQRARAKFMMACSRMITVCIDLEAQRTGKKAPWADAEAARPQPAGSGAGSHAPPASPDEPREDA